MSIAATPLTCSQVAASLKPVTNSSGSNKKRAREQRGTSESPTKASPSKQDVFGKEQAREMLQPTKVSILLHHFSRK